MALNYWRKLFALILALQCVASSVYLAAPAFAVDPVTKEAIENTQKTPEASYLDLPRVVLKNGSTFMVLTPDGMMTQDPSTPYGVYNNDTRMMCGYTLKIDGEPVTLVSSSTQDGYKANFEYDNRVSNTPAKSVAIKREIVIDAPASRVAERLTLQNHGATTAEFDLEVSFNFDYKDMFEVRGQTRKQHGITYRHISVPAKEKHESKVATLYSGLDKKFLKSEIAFPLPAPSAITSNHCHYSIVLEPNQSLPIEIAYSSATDLAFNSKPENFETILKRIDQQAELWRRENISLQTDNPTFNQIFNQAVDDLFILKIDTPRGPGYAAGLPWYAVAFGRDQVITALQTLDFAPNMAKEVITLLAKYQGTKEDKFTEETPGKIMHELRTGEMARCKEIPFIPYYGTIDATPLWLVLVSRYCDVTGDTKLALEHWPNIEAALNYLKRSTPDDFLYYGSRSEAGKQAALTNQAWKDSGDSVMHKDGTLASAPIAICEVQGYLYDAYTGTAKLAKKLGKKELAAELNGRADKLKAHFDKSFWLPPEKFVALALDATREPCDVVASNPGHLLSSGIIDSKQADAISNRLMKSDMFSGWGIRTLSSKEKRYDPKSYHDGSVWPHDNALIVEGMTKRGHQEEASRVIAALFEVAAVSPDKRLPELFCGFQRQDETTPVPYNVSCVPQLWCVGSVFQMVKGMTGLSATGGKITLEHPRLPNGVNDLTMNFPARQGQASQVVKIKRDRRTGVITSTVRISGSRQNQIISKITHLSGS